MQIEGEKQEEQKFTYSVCSIKMLQARLSMKIAKDLWQNGKWQMAQKNMKMNKLHNNIQHQLAKSQEQTSMSFNCLTITSILNYSIIIDDDNRLIEAYVLLVNFVLLI